MGKELVTIRKIDYAQYIGQSFNNLTVKDVGKLNGKSAVLCDCQCGTKDKWFQSSDVINKRINGCGLCHLRSMIGKVSGRLTVVGINEETKNCICKCECGNEHYETKSNNITSQRVKSCGCIAKELKNSYEFVEDYVIGTTNLGDKFYFDKEDFEKVNKYTWRVSHNGYIQTSAERVGSQRKVLEMHSYLIGEHKGFVIDHINRNKRDNRRVNLRLVDNSMNGFNITRQSNNTTGKTGVYYNKKNNNYMAKIGYRNRCIYLGSYVTFEDAVEAREKAELKYFGELANN